MNVATQIVQMFDNARATAWDRVQESRKVRLVENIIIDFEEITIDFVDGQMEIDSVEFLDIWNRWDENMAPVDIDSICNRIHEDDVLMYLNLEKNINAQWAPEVDVNELTRCADGVYR